MCLATNKVQWALVKLYVCDTIIIYEFIELAAPTINVFDYFLFFFSFLMRAQHLQPHSEFSENHFWGTLLSINTFIINNTQTHIKKHLLTLRNFSDLLCFSIYAFLCFLLLVEMKLRKNWLKKHFWGECFAMESCRTIVSRNIVRDFNLFCYYFR